MGESVLVEFQANGHKCKMAYYLPNGIFLKWAIEATSKTPM
jgi:hypothetical protein